MIHTVTYTKDDFGFRNGESETSELTVSCGPDNDFDLEERFEKCDAGPAGPVSRFFISWSGRAIALFSVATDILRTENSRVYS
ncbi:MAG: hypothetical protein ACLFQB_12575 [Chitinispirillaceae bacterium]